MSKYSSSLLTAGPASAVSLSFPLNNNSAWMCISCSIQSCTLCSPSIHQPGIFTTPKGLPKMSTRLRLYCGFGNEIKDKERWKQMIRCGNDP
ncbi:hypothetical protein LDENG_00226620 [Lucifuga dentata]|nr:hypothetical protein LDENG_00226620 [Lucifuga dentata]